MSSNKFTITNNNISPLWERIQILCQRENITQTVFRKKIGISNSYLTEIKNGRSKATGGKLWDAIRTHYPQYEDYLRNRVDTPPRPASGSSNVSASNDKILSFPTHEDIIKQFVDTEWAKAINSSLVELEQFAPDKKALIKGFIEGIVLQAKTRPVQQSPKKHKQAV